MRIYICLFIFSVLSAVLGRGIDRPNVIIYLSDDHGADDAACLGNPDLQTPIIDQMAREGMIFSRAFSATSVCTPSRSVLFTGLYPHSNGCDQNHGRIRSGIRTLPAYLKPLGYQVVLAGKKHIRPENAFDFDYIGLHDIPEFLEHIGNTPFCLIIATHTPHQPYFNHKSGYRNITPKVWMPDTKETRQFTAAYYDHVDLLDRELGSYLYWVEKYGYDHALQIYTSDHGPAFPFAKWTLYNQGIRVPFIVKWSGKVPPNSTINALISLTDLLPTLIETAGGQVPDGLDGKSLLSLFQGHRESIHDQIYATYTNQGVNGANTYPIRAIIGNTYKLIVNIRHENEFHIKRMDEPDDRAVTDSYKVIQSWIKSGKGERARQFLKRPAIELYQIKTDPYELNNLATNTEYRQVISKMMDDLLVWMETQGDPLTDEMKALKENL
ncbi:sulfatase [Membranicola marinus]|uniref:Sulfatase n=1 Tax=Membranihabitans marinus TaxID=1227546 RepID=A0A953HVT3_9BACT|nr:sulfatase [Membranihabitans marinus]MBY5959390.1 sulfatase [Membranihabitans marinus]